MAIVDKILALHELQQVLERARKAGSVVVMCHGTFDLLHLGHIKHFEQARAYGDLLVVTVTPDCHVNKGVHRPVFSERQRAETIASLGVVDFVAVNEWETASETIRRLRPNVFCKGGEFRHLADELPSGLKAEIAAVEEVGGRVEYTEDNLFSSSHLINNHLRVFSPQVDDWLRSFRSRHSADTIIEIIENLKTLRVLVLGEAIVDEYVFCEGLGKATKDPVIASLYRSTERYGGGSLAVANHVAGFCDSVDLVTFLGDMERHEDLVKQSLRSNVRTRFLTRRSTPTINKRRFVDTHTGARIFEIYTMADVPLNSEDEQVLIDEVRNTIADYDVVVVADYGHGMFTPSLISLLCSSAPFLAVNTQANAGNRGFNTISRYPCADYVCLAMHEVALETRMRYADWRELVQEVTKKIRCPHFTVTWGKNGTLHYTTGGDFIETPALATQVKDRVGAGDALFAITSLLVARKIVWDVVGFVGNLAGAQMVADLGNRVTIDRESMVKNITSLMK